MTGINQTLLLAISMLGIAAIMGAGGLGRLLFRSLSNQNVALAASAGLAFFLVAVVLDRISQREGTDEGNLFARIRQAWAHRRDPEALLQEVDVEVDVEVPTEEQPRYEPLTARERTAMGIAALGGLVAVVATFLPWSKNAGKISAYGSRADAEQMAGLVFDGLHASGGSFFGILVLVSGLFVIASVVKVLWWPGRGVRWLTVDGALLAGFAGTATAAAFLLARPYTASGAAIVPETGFGVFLAIVGGLIASAGAVSWIRVAPHTPLHPLPAGISWGRIIGVVLALLFVVGGSFGGWSWDQRTDVVVSPELQAEVEDLRAQAEANPAQAAVIANQINQLLSTAAAESAIVLDGVSQDGAGLGLVAIVLTLVAVGTTLPGAGVFGTEERKLWTWSAYTGGLGLAVTAIAFAWIFTFVRNADPGFIAGVGSFIVLMGGFFVLASTMSVLKEFRRARVYDDEPASSDADTREEEPAGELV